ARLSHDAESVSLLTELAQPLHLFDAELEPATTATAAALAAAGAEHWPEDRHLLEDLLDRALVGRGFGRLVGPFLVRRVRVSHPVLPCSGRARAQGYRPAREVSANPFDTW